MKNRSWRTVILSTLVVLLALGMAGPGYAQLEKVTYKVTITNLTQGQPLTPPLVATHRAGIHLFEAGQLASFELKEVAENGNLDPLMKALQQHMAVSDVVVAVAGDPPPLLPGKSVTFSINADADATFLSFVSMLVCTNDGFTGLDSIRLPDGMDKMVTLTAMAYDAGTERNTEQFADLVPPCPVLTGVESMAEGSGTSNPALAEGGVIGPHPGVQGTGELDPALHGWAGPIAQVVIVREEQMMMPQRLPVTGAAERMPRRPWGMLGAGLMLVLAGGVGLWRQRGTA